jgi:hypothetical protein
MAFGTHLRAMMQHEVSAVDVEGLLRGSGQLEDLRQQIEAQRQEGELAHPGRPWETHRAMGPALALFWVSQAFMAIARNLKEADEAFDPCSDGTGELGRAGRHIERCWASACGTSHRTWRPRRSRVLLGQLVLTACIRIPYWRKALPNTVTISFSPPPRRSP